MEMFQAIPAEECCLCGSPEKLTGEHKIKASALRRIFGNEAMVIGHFDGTSEPRLAQGPKSRALHFDARLCGNCNSAETQPADREFDRFHEHVSERFERDPNAENFFPVSSYPDGSPETLNVFRYFAKLLTCQIAHGGGPRLPTVAAFALGMIDFNSIKLNVRADPTYCDYTRLSGDYLGFAGHGGLVVNHTRSGELSGFHSTLTLGPIQYVYWVEFNCSVSADLEAADPKYFSRMQDIFRKAVENPMSDQDRRKLGFLSRSESN